MSHHDYRRLRLADDPAAKAGHDAAPVPDDDRRAHVQVLPFDSGAHPAIDSPFYLLEFGDDLPTIGYHEYASGAVWIEHPQAVGHLKNIHSDLIADSPNVTETRSLVARTIDEIRTGR